VVVVLRQQGINSGSSLPSTPNAFNIAMANQLTEEKISEFKGL
jgi:hypothetical protein